MGEPPMTTSRFIAEATACALAVALMFLGGIAMIVSATDQSFPNPHYFTVEPR
jgi:hypothetical protein